MTRLLLWATGLPAEVYVLASIVACSFWTAVVLRRIDRRMRVDLDEQWQRFTGRKP